jgi:hypothetical protein
LAIERAATIAYHAAAAIGVAVIVALVVGVLP